MAQLTHVDEDGNAKMVDVGDKKVTRRKAVASGKVFMKPDTVKAIREGAVKKGDVLAVARIAGIQTAKKTSDLIPLTHPLPIDHLSVDFKIKAECIEIICEASVEAKTGVEMEALCAVSGAALCIYDMAKAIDKAMIISDIKLLSKSGGRSGDWKANQD
jgi:cyclic pyranopterin monophosphate synthase